MSVMRFLTPESLWSEDPSVTRRAFGAYGNYLRSQWPRVPQGMKGLLKGMVDPAAVPVAPDALCLHDAMWLGAEWRKDDEACVVRLAADRGGDRSELRIVYQGVKELTLPPCLPAHETVLYHELQILPAPRIAHRYLLQSEEVVEIIFTSCEVEPGA